MLSLTTHTMTSAPTLTLIHLPVHSLTPVFSHSHSCHPCQHSHGAVLPPSVFSPMFSPMCSHSPTHTHTHQSLCSLPLPFTSFSPNPTLAALTAIPHTLPIPPTPFHPIMPPSHHHHISTSTLTNRCQSPPITSIPSPEHFAPFHFALRQKSDRLVNP